MSNYLRYCDNGQDFLIRLDGKPADIDALAVRFEREAAKEVEGDQAAGDLVAMDAIWAATPMEDAMGLADRLHEVTRDADLEIRRLRHRCNALIWGGLCIASGCLVVGVLIGWWLA